MSSHPLYNTTRWRKLRLKVLKESPLCVFCLEVGRTTPANVVDHIKAHRGNERLFWDRNNLQSLCKRCHDSRKQRIEKRGIAPGCTASGMPTDQNHPWNK